MNGQFKMEITKNQQVTFKTGYSVEAGGDHNKIEKSNEIVI